MVDLSSSLCNKLPEGVWKIMSDGKKMENHETSTYQHETAMCPCESAKRIKNVGNPSSTSSLLLFHMVLFHSLSHILPPGFKKASAKHGDVDNSSNVINHCQPSFIHRS